MDDNKKIDTAFKLLDNVQSLIKFADTKINVLLVISGVTTTFILTNFQNLCELNCFSKIILGLFFLAFITFVILSILTISPRTDNTQVVHLQKQFTSNMFQQELKSRILLTTSTNSHLKVV